MPETSETLRAAWIAGFFTVAAAIVGAIATIVVSVLKHRKNTRHSFSETSKSENMYVHTTGPNSHAVAFGGDVKDSNIFVGTNDEQILPKKVEPIVKQILLELESIPSGFKTNTTKAFGDILEPLEKSLDRDAYDVPSLIIRGQCLIKRTIFFGGPGIVEALDCFYRAAEADDTIADPHFGIGTVLYHAALFDLAKRGRYTLIKKGHITAPQDNRPLWLNIQITKSAQTKESKIFFKLHYIVSSTATNYSRCMKITKTPSWCFMLLTTWKAEFAVLDKFLGTSQS